MCGVGVQKGAAENKAGRERWEEQQSSLGGGNSGEEKKRRVTWTVEEDIKQ